MRWAAVLLLLGACTSPDSQEVSVQWLDYDVFVSDVQPILANECGNPSCHGRGDRPFSVFSPRGWRIDPEQVHLPGALSDDELTHNYTMSCVFVSDADSPEESLLLKKPLGASGGSYHGGGVIFDGVTDRDYRTLLAWIEESSSR